MSKCTTYGIWADDGEITVRSLDDVAWRVEVHDDDIDVLHDYLDGNPSLDAVIGFVDGLKAKRGDCE